MTTLRTYIVEDSPMIRENLIATLEELVALEVVGYAEDEATAVQWLRNPANECQLTIVDIFLKQGSGIGVLLAMLELSKKPNRVVLSNFATMEMRRRCLALGADKVFDKSNEIDALILYCKQLAADQSDDSNTDALDRVI